MNLLRNTITTLLLFAYSLSSLAEVRPETKRPPLSGVTQHVSVASIHWCPYICLDKEKPGVLTEYVKKIFAGTPYTLSFTTLPWARAIYETQTGNYQALMAPAREEAPGLVFPTRPLGYQYMCLFTRSDDPWRYEGVESLKGRRVVYGYGAYPASLEGAEKLAAFYPMPYSQDFIPRGVKMVLNKRTDTLLFTVYSTQHYLNENGLADKMQIAGCAERQAVYLAFTPSEAARETSHALIRLVDAKIEILEKKHTFDTLLKAYGLKPR